MFLIINASAIGISKNIKREGTSIGRFRIIRAEMRGFDENCAVSRRVFYTQGKGVILRYTRKQGNGLFISKHSS